MSKLFRLKKWLTVEDAARHIANICEENVSAADVLRLALDGYLKLSIQFVNDAYGRPCVPVKLDELEYTAVPRPIADVGPGLPMLLPVNGRLWQEDDGRYFQVQRKIIELKSGVWDLPLTGGERHDVEHQYQTLTGGPPVTAVTMDGVFVNSPAGDLFEIQSRYDNGPSIKRNLSGSQLPYDSPENFHPAGGLPHESVFVVRTAALAEFEQLIRDGERQETTEAPDKPLATRERNGLLTALAVTCKLASLDYTKPSKTAQFISAEGERMGLRIPDSSVEKYLKLIPNALETRMK